MEQLRICALSPQLLPGRRRIRSLEDLLVQNAQSASRCALRSPWIVHTCESGSMVASDEPLPSLEIPFGTSLGCPVGEVGLRTLAASLPLLPLDLDISIDAKVYIEIVRALPSPLLLSFPVSRLSCGLPAPECGSVTLNFGNRSAMLSIPIMGNVNCGNNPLLQICGQSGLLGNRAQSCAAKIQTGVPYLWLHKDLVAAEWPGNRVNRSREPRISIHNTRFVLMQSTVWFTDKQRVVLRRGRYIESENKQFS